MKMVLSLAWSFNKIATPLPIDAVLCRLYFSEDIAKDFTVNETFQPKGFVSCTYKEEFINRWITKYEQSEIHWLLILLLPRSFPVLSLSKLSNYGDSEGEFILPFNTPLKVTKIDLARKHVHPDTVNPYRTLSAIDQYKAFTNMWMVDDYYATEEEENDLKASYANMCGFRNCA